MTATPARIDIAGDHHGCCNNCGNPLQPGEVVYDFNPTPADRWPWWCDPCARHRLARGGAR